MSLSRRGFLFGASAAGAGAILAPIAAPAVIRNVSSLMKIAPKPVLLRSNSILTIDHITREAIRLWLESSKYEIVGKQFRVKLPNEYSVYL